MTLAELINKSKNGDQIAQRLLFEMTCDHLKSVASRYVLDESSAEDVLQESYIRIFKSVQKFNYINDAATYGWMRQITATEAIRYLKKTKRWESAAVQSQNAPGVANSAAFEKDLYKILLMLSPRQRIVFNLFAIEGYSHKEIAKKLEIAESSSRSLLTRARTFLQLQLTKNDNYVKI